MAEAPKNPMLAAGKVKFETGQRVASGRNNPLIIGSVSVITVVILVILYFVVMGTGPTKDRATAEATVKSYTQFVLPYVPPSSSSPTQPVVTAWLKYFDSDSQAWFRENADALSRAASRSDLETWKGWARGKREMEAMRHIVALAPLRGVVVAGAPPEAPGDTAEIEVLSGASKFKIRMEKTRNGWVFDDMMGLRLKLDEMVRTAPPAP